MKTNEQDVPWWQQMLTRREANKTIAKIGIATLAAATAVGVVGCGDDSEDFDDGATEVQQDALELQKKEGWNAGSTDKQLTFTGKTGTDSQGSMDWANYNTSAALLKAWGVKNSAWQPYVVPTLVQALDQASLKGQIGPVFTPAMRDAYSRGLGMREILQKSKNPETTMIVVDIPGPEAVAYAAALADVADPVITFDNWPHPLGVVKSHETLGAMLYYAAEVSAKAAKRTDKAAAALVLDANRIVSNVDPDTQFDNRYLAKVPTADKLQAMKTTNVLYAVPDKGVTAERDDLNEDFAAYKEKGINVSMIALSDFTPDPNEKPDSAASLAGSGTTTTTHHTVYHYGGSPFFSPWFFYHYPVFIGSGIPAASRLPATSMRGSTYSPARRPTMFSGRTVGGGSGVGKQRPSGFGRVSTRVDGTGRTTGIRSGSSGSYGRSSGRGYSG
ncbi:MAG: hypothetical protein DYG96_00825 [Chlorobi bacterium CHB2]|nr:hypothetical protein [Chlorobi bacterium CHB2]